jgi:hypothetical protein
MYAGLTTGYDAEDAENEEEEEEAEEEVIARRTTWSVSHAARPRSKAWTAAR